MPCTAKFNLSKKLMIIIKIMIILCTIQAVRSAKWKLHDSGRQSGG